MESHESYPAIAALCIKYPKHAQSLFQVYNDILYTQQWLDVSAEEIPDLSRGIVIGRKEADEGLRVVVPCSLAEDLSIGWLNTIFAHHSPTPSEIWVGIVSDDSSLVYYKLSKGIVKPPM